VARFVPDELVPEIIEKTIEWYKTNGVRGERIGLTLRRVGVESYLEFMKPVLGEYIVREKETA